DGPFGDDMNRNWPSDWQPNYIQFGAGPYPLSAPETRAIAEFIRAHPNIAAGQSYHNSGGMILRGPGTSYRNPMYANADARVYDELAQTGELLLPYYRDMVIYRDLYNVHGGFVNFLAEGLGVFSFTNEMWASGKMFQKDIRVDEDKQWLWRDRMALGQTFTDYTEYQHPTYGNVLIGGPNKWSSRNTPTFMLEEECHRNFAFTTFHADHMPLLRFKRTEVEDMGGGLWQVTVEIANEKLIPTRSAMAQNRGIGAADILETIPPEGGRVVAAGRLSGWLDRQMSAVRHEPHRLQVEEGIPSQGSRIFRLLVEGAAGEVVTLRYAAEKALDIETTVTLEAPAEGAP
ncbi:MAG: M14 family zinc carboxypeptidase, partial [Phycisphaerales bacterium JB039]